MSHYLAEFVGTALMILLGDGVCACNTLNKSKAKNSGWLLVAIGWALAVGIPAMIFGPISGAHFNPAVTISFALIGKFPWSEVPGYVICQLLGAILGATLVWLQYLPHWKITEDKSAKLGVFCTGPAVRSYGANFMSEFIATFVLIFSLLGCGTIKTANGMGTIFVTFVILVIGVSLGGTTGYAINPARDLGPRIAHFILPIAGKGDSDWSYSWVPVFGPLLGGALGALLFYLIF